MLVTLILLRSAAVARLRSTRSLSSLWGKLADWGRTLSVLHTQNSYLGNMEAPVGFD